MTAKRDEIIATTCELLEVQGYHCLLYTSRCV